MTSSKENLPCLVRAGCFLLDTAGPLKANCRNEEVNLSIAEKAFLSALLVLVGGYWFFRVFGLFQELYRARKKESNSLVDKSNSHFNSRTDSRVDSGGAEVNFVADVSQQNESVQAPPVASENFGREQLQTPSVGADLERQNFAESRVLAHLRAGRSETVSAAKQYFDQQFRQLRNKELDVGELIRMIEILVDRGVDPTVCAEPDFRSQLVSAAKKRKNFKSEYPAKQFSQFAGALEFPQTGLGFLRAEDVEFLVSCPDTLLLQQLNNDQTARDAALLIGLLAPERALILADHLPAIRRKLIYRFLANEVAECSVLRAENLIRRLKLAINLGSDRGGRDRASTLAGSLYRRSSKVETQELASGNRKNDLRGGWLDSLVKRDNVEGVKNFEQQARNSVIPNIQRALDADKASSMGKELIANFSNSAAVRSTSIELND